MTKLISRSIALLASAALAGAASAQSDNPWNGGYAGFNVGEAHHNSCVSGTLSGASIDPATAAAFASQICPGGGSFVGGLQIGDDFQYKKLVLGVGLDLDTSRAKNQSQSLKYAGAAPPPGTYNFSGKLDPNGFAVFSARIGYSSLQWMPYLKVGALVAAGAHDSTFSYTPTGAIKPLASFNGGKSFSSTGWVAGAGVEYGLNGPWSITAEYLSENLGQGSNSSATCSGPAGACTGFSGIAFDTSHGGFKANIIRIGINYWFGYW